MAGYKLSWASILRELPRLEINVGPFAFDGAICFCVFFVFLFVFFFVGKDATESGLESGRTGEPSNN